jgi:hypothetical protein
MGQRTQIAIVIEDKVNNENTLKVYHDQWGLGRRMYLVLMSLANKYYFEGNSYNTRDFVKNFEVGTNEVRKIWEKNISESDVHKMMTPEGAEDLVFSHCDNNNGGLVIRVAVNDWNNRDKNIFEFGFLMGYEDARMSNNALRFGKAFSRWLSAEEFASIDINKEYADEEFISMFNQFTKYFGLRSIASEAKVEAR